MAVLYEPPVLTPKNVESTGRLEDQIRLFNASLALLDARGAPLPYLAEALPELNSATWRVNAGLVRKALPVGAPKGARPNYEIDDAYLAFWFGVLYSSLPEIETRQGAAVLSRVEPTWQRHLGAVFEEASRSHARRLVERGDLSSDLVVGRWWATSGEPCEVDILGLRGGRSHLLGEARWQQRPLDGQDLEALRRKIARVPSPTDAPVYALWGRGGDTRGAASGRPGVRRGSGAGGVSLAQPCVARSIDPISRDRPGYGLPDPRTK